MSRKHFEAVAAQFKYVVTTHAVVGENPHPVTVAFLNGVVAAIHAAADVFADANPRFDRTRFLAACGIN